MAQVRSQLPRNSGGVVRDGPAGAPAHGELTDLAAAALGGLRVGLGRLLQELTSRTTTAVTGDSAGTCTSTVQGSLLLLADRIACYYKLYNESSENSTLPLKHHVMGTLSSWQMLKTVAQHCARHFMRVPVQKV